MTPVELLSEVIKEHSPRDIWTDSPLIGYRKLGNTNRGEIGEEFLRRYLRQHGLPVDVPHNNRGRTSLTDMRIGEHAFEVKTASLGASQTFQFNHVRLDRKYNYLLCLGICPHEIVFNFWSKGEVAESVAGTLVRMAEGQSTTSKLTKRLADMLPIADLPDTVRALEKAAKKPSR